MTESVGRDKRFISSLKRHQCSGTKENVEIIPPLQPRPSLCEKIT